MKEDALLLGMLHPLHHVLEEKRPFHGHLESMMVTQGYFITLICLYLADVHSLPIPRRREDHPGLRTEVRSVWREGLPVVRGHVLDQVPIALDLG